jgi:hypothetical protein
LKSGCGAVRLLVVLRADDEPVGVGGSSRMKVFINYRREDTEAYARLLYDRLSKALGRDAVYLDVANPTPGVRYLEHIKSTAATSWVFLALIGPHWLSSMTRRSQARFEQPATDLVKLEIELALSRGSGLKVVPILLGGAVMPNGESLPRSLRPLPSLQAIELRHAHFDEDFEVLVGAVAEVSEVGERPEVGPASSQPTAVVSSSRGPTRSDSGSPSTPDKGAHAPNDRHFEAVLRYMLDDDGVVPVLGRDVNGTPLEGQPILGGASLPNSGELARDLAERFGLDLEHHDLAKVAQQVYLTSGSPDLHRTLRRLLPAEAAPSAVHRFLAAFPTCLDRASVERRFQMIITTNYDVALERAFDEANEPYDLLVYMASGDDRGRFVHFPFDSDPEPINVPNQYAKLPIDEDGEVERSLIVKIHGAVDGSSGGYGWRNNYVITEDEYIEYLSRGPIENLVPIQILDKLAGAHCLFLGYSMNDWNSRVFLQRIWKGASIPAKSWAIEPNPGSLETDFWQHSGVDLLAAPLAGYVEQLARRIVSGSPARR